MKLKRAVCNELFGDIGFEGQCGLLSEYGFHGVEIAPFTLFAGKGRISEKTTMIVRKSLRASGIAFAGLHWLLSKPDGLHITSPDRTVRKRTREHLKRLLSFAGDLGGGNLILGSPNQRSSSGITTGEAVRMLEEELAALADYASECNSRILLEALPAASTDVVNTLEEVRNILRLINHPGISGMFDFHNCEDETLSWEELVTEYSSMIRHVHLNTREGDYPKRKDVPSFQKTFESLEAAGYEGWVSLEVFRVHDKPEELLEQTKLFLDEIRA